MRKKMVLLLLGFLCGKLFIEWFPIGLPVDFSKFLLALVLQPFDFLIASIFFIAGFLMNAVILENGVRQITMFVYRKQVVMEDLLIFLFLLLGYCILFISGFWQTMVFFCFSLLYGMISIDFKRLIV
ncbi:hypothetical protein [Robertmurraya andreesenii]|uniref:Uncharacterized protein n=1 Tax=Anoxybacillus andreesenii TaxID=1325932 RepID=A0ABT9V8B1_9BACL|nr:hypothetical protein [Robertmurraya andreesenii]MDQ0157195.1 hypothetical protein [Robertmurraya andreesenii]